MNTLCRPQKTQRKLVRLLQRLERLSAMAPIDFTVFICGEGSDEGDRFNNGPKFRAVVVQVIQSVNSIYHLKFYSSSAVLRHRLSVR